MCIQTVCEHKKTKVVREMCFRGSVSREENRAAHGNIQLEVECLDCGARRAENRNGAHAEVGEWGDSAVEREIHARTLEKAARALCAKRPSPITLHRKDQSCTISIDEFGYFLLSSSALDVHDIAAAAPEFFEAAQALRWAVKAARAARAEA
jgi:hypothetical protein